MFIFNKRKELVWNQIKIIIDFIEYNSVYLEKLHEKINSIFSAFVCDLFSGIFAR